MLILTLAELSLTITFPADSHLRVHGQLLTLTLICPFCGGVIDQVELPIVAQVCHVVEADWVYAQA